MFASRSRFVGLLALIVLLFAVGTVGADFSWTQSQGPPSFEYQKGCNLSEVPCVPDGCTALNPARVVMYDSKSYNVKSYDRISDYTHGFCGTVPIPAPSLFCYKYPFGYKECGSVRQYFDDNCSFLQRLNITDVYGGNCNQ